MKPYKDQELWFITGSQHLYGEEVLNTVREHSSKIAGALAASNFISVEVKFIDVVTSAEDVFNTCRNASSSPKCIGVILWMHTFSPAKMWINGLKALQKPVCHLHTQFNRSIPWSDIDMDFMNLNQSAHGDREFGFMMTRMRTRRKVITGYWEDAAVHRQIDTWARACAAWNDWQGAKFVRFGDNMRHVAVTEGDKVEANLKFGFSVNTYGVTELAAVVDSISEEEVNSLCDTYAKEYALAAGLEKGGKYNASLRDAARIEVGIRKFLVEGNYKGYTDTFEDLASLKQLPGIATQRLMNDGYGFGGEGDWKTAALVRAMKVMAMGLKGGNSFMEDYTYHFEEGHETVLGSHMLEICPSIATGKPGCEIHPLGIGGKADPVRLVFNTGSGDALNASLIDMGNRFRLVVNEVKAVEPEYDLPKLPVARVLWKPLPDMYTACTAWILAGGAHHTCYSQNLTVEHLEDFTDMAGIEMVLINADTTVRTLKQEMRWSEAYYTLCEK